jgi:hypothetical protein
MNMLRSKKLDAETIMEADRKRRWLTSAAALPAGRARRFLHCQLAPRKTTLQLWRLSNLEEELEADAGVAIFRTERFWDVERLFF